MKKRPKKRVSFHRATAHGVRLGLTPSQAVTLSRLHTPERIQDYINAIPINFEFDGDTCLPVGEALRQHHAHCIEGALVAACTLWMHGQPPLLMDMQAVGDDDHVVALFRRGRFWGAISKSNHVWLRWRDPVYRSLRELALSYFHEYVTRQFKTLRSYSVSFDLRRFDPKIWIGGRASCWEIATAIDEVRHYPLITPAQARQLRHRDPIEVLAGKLLDFKAPSKRTSRP